jgi:hypothetical protein
MAIRTRIGLRQVRALQCGEIVWDALDAVDCASRRHDAADGEHMAWAVRPVGLGGFGRSAATWPRAQVWRGDGRILAVLENTPPVGFARQTGLLIAAEPGDVHEHQVWHFLRAQRIRSGRAQIVVRER